MSAGQKEYKLVINGVKEIITDVSKLEDELNKLDAAIRNSKEITNLSSKAADDQNKILAETIKANNDTSKAIEGQNKELKDMLGANNQAQSSTQNLNVELQSLAVSYTKVAISNEKITKSDYLKGFETLTGAIEKVTERAHNLSEAASVGIDVFTEFGGSAEEAGRMQKDLAVFTSVFTAAEKLNNGLIKDNTLANAAYKKILSALGLTKKKVAIETEEVTVAIEAETEATDAQIEATETQIEVTEGATEATEGLKEGMASTGVGALVIAIGLLVANFDQIKKYITDALPILNQLGDVWNNLKVIIMGVANVITNFIEHAFKGLIEAFIDFINLDFKKLLNDVKTQTKEAIDFQTAYEAGASKQRAQNEKNALQDRAKRRAEDLQEEIKVNEAKFGSDFKYTQNGQKLYKEMYENRLLMYDKDSADYKKVLLEKDSFTLDSNNHAAEVAKERAKNQLDAIRKEQDSEVDLMQEGIKQKEALLTYSYDREIEDLKKVLHEKQNLSKKAADEIRLTLENLKQKELTSIQQLEDKAEQDRLTAEKATADKIVVTTAEELNKKKVALENYYKGQAELDNKQNAEEIENTSFRYKQLIAQAKIMGKDTTLLEQEREEQLNSIKEKYASKEILLETQKKETISAIDKAANDKKLAAEKAANDKKEAEEKAANDKKEADEKAANDKELKLLDDNLSEKQKAIDDAATVNKKTINELGYVLKANGNIDVSESKRVFAEKNKLLKEYVDNLTAEKAKLESGHTVKLATLDPVKDKKAYDEEVKNYNTAKDTITKKSAEANKQIEKNTKASHQTLTQALIAGTKKVSDAMAAVAMGTGAMAKAMTAVMQDQLDEINKQLTDISKKNDEVTKQQQTSADKVKSLQDEIKTASGGTAKALTEQMMHEMATRDALAAKQKKLAAEKADLEAKAAKKQKEMKKIALAEQIVEGVANGAAATLKALDAAPPPFNFILAGIVAASAAVQVGVISKQLSKLEDGGLIAAPSHAAGGARIQGTNIEVEGGEFVVNKQSTAANASLLGFINNARAPLTANDLATVLPTVGSTAPVVLNTPINNDDRILNAISTINFKPQVAVTDIRDAQNTMVGVQDDASFR